jgi:hypothetical protein
VGLFRVPTDIALTTSRHEGNHYGIEGRRACPPADSAPLMVLPMGGGTLLKQAEFHKGGVALPVKERQRVSDRVDAVGACETER